MQESKTNQDPEATEPLHPYQNPKDTEPLQPYQDPEDTEPLQMYVGTAEQDINEARPVKEFGGGHRTAGDADSFKDGPPTPESLRESDGTPEAESTAPPDPSQNCRR